jgi:hypothetical protein
VTSVSTVWFEFNQNAAGGIHSLADMQPVEISTVAAATCSDGWTA